MRSLERGIGARQKRLHIFHLMRQHRLRHTSHGNLRDPGSRGDLPLPRRRLEGEGEGR